MDKSRGGAIGRALLIHALCAPVFWGCSDGSQSAPVEIGDWTIDLHPVVVFGAEEMTPEAALHSVVDATRLSDGRVVVANGGLASRLPVFSEDGRYIGTIGAQGEGPGEYQWVTSVQTSAGDSLHVFDAALQRLTTFLPSGEVTTTPHRVSPGAGERLRVVARLNGGAWAVLGLESPMSGGLDAILQDTVVAGILDERLEEFQLLEHVPGRMSMTFEVGGRRAFGGVAFSPRAFLAASGGCVFVTDGVSPGVSLYSASGGRLSVVETGNSSTSVTEAHRQEWINYRLGWAEPEQREAFRSGLRDIPWVNELPRFNQMVADRWGRLWLQIYESPTGLGRHWDLYTPHGERLGRVSLPTSMIVFEITEHGILGMSRGDFDEELVMLLSLGSVPVPTTLFAPCA